MPPEKIIGHTVGIGRVSADRIKYFTIAAKEIDGKHNYLVTIIWVNGDKVLIEQLLDSFLEKKSVLG